MTVTVHGRPAAMPVAVDDIESMEETIALLSDRAVVKALAEADAELARGEGEDDVVGAGDACSSSDRATDAKFELIVAPTARRQLAGNARRRWRLLRTSSSSARCWRTRTGSASRCMLPWRAATALAGVRIG
ncbi:MAG: hypothetical protein R2705_04215 [Ilumatobacteraceae bacterium]